MSMLDSSYTLDVVNPCVICLVSLAVHHLCSVLFNNHAPVSAHGRQLGILITVVKLQQRVPPNPRAILAVDAAVGGHLSVLTRESAFVRWSHQACAVSQAWSDHLTKADSLQRAGCDLHPAAAELCKESEWYVLWDIK